MPTVISELNIDLKSLSEDQLKYLTILTAYNTNILIRNQNLSKKEYASILRTFGKNQKRDLWFEDKDNHELMYVTNKHMLGKEKKQGLFATGELDWHCNGPMSIDPEDCVTLYCKQPTQDPCNTEFVNGVIAYNTLPKDVKKQISNTKIFLSNDAPQFQRLKFDFYTKMKRKPRMIDSERVYKVHDAINLEGAAELNRCQIRSRNQNSSIEKEVYKNKEKYSDGGIWNYMVKKIVHPHRLTGVIGLYLPLLNVVGFDDIPEDEWYDLYFYLKGHYLKEVYSHEWKVGDLILFDNTQGLHKRQPFPLDKSGNEQKRELWRGAFWYDNIH